MVKLPEGFMEGVHAGQQARAEGSMRPLVDVLVSLADIPTRLAGAKRPDGELVFSTPVRVPCRVCQSTGLIPTDTTTTPTWGCPKCGSALDTTIPGRGWTASKDGWVWWQAARDIGIHLKLAVCGFEDKLHWRGEVPDQPGICHHDGPKAAFFATLLAAVQALGAEVPDA